MSEDQLKYWNGSGGDGWVELQPLLDEVFAPFTKLLLQEVTAPPARALDIGCGAGDTTLAVARSFATDCIGIDISKSLVSAAQERTKRERLRAHFICADAATYSFEAESFDFLISRFGLMFFADPVPAFVNLRRAAKRAAELRFVAWRSPADNPFMIVAERAARPFLPHVPERNPDAPGQFAFSNSRRISSILVDSGWNSIDIRPVDAECSFAATDLVRYLTKLGLLGRVLGESDSATRARIIEAVRRAFDPYVFGSEVRFSAACWLVGARNN